MALRKIGEVQNGERKAVIHFIPAAHEFRVRLWLAGVCDPEADYFTNDREDAEGTAQAMVAGGMVGRSEYLDDLSDAELACALFESRG